MITSALCFVSILAVGQQPVTLARVFVKGEKAEYKVHSVLHAEGRQAGLETWMPSDYDLIYNFTYAVTDMKSDGIAVMQYKRPTMTEILGETFDRPPQTKVEKTNLDFNLQVSPLNEIIKLEVNKPKPKTPERKPPTVRMVGKNGLSAPQIQEFFGQFVQEVYRLALFAGSMDSSLDFAPSLPIDEVSPGDTWKKTVGYSPQKLAGGGGKFAVQRLDYTFTYKGTVTVNGKPYHRVDGLLTLKTDLAEYIHSASGLTARDTNLKTAPLTLDATIAFDLDPKTFRTVRAEGATKGGFSLSINGINVPVEETRFKSTTKMFVVSHKTN